MNILEEVIIKQFRMNIIKNGIYPSFGEPTCKCKDCSFYMIACFPRKNAVGCYSGWDLKGKTN